MAVKVVFTEATARDDGFAFGSTVRSLLPWLSPDARRTSHEAHAGPGAGQAGEVADG